METLEIQKLAAFQKTATEQTFRLIFRGQYNTGNAEEIYRQFNKTYKRDFLMFFQNINQHEQEAIAEWVESQDE